MVGQRALQDLNVSSDASQLWPAVEKEVFRRLRPEIGGPDPELLFRPVRQPANVSSEYSELTPNLPSNDSDQVSDHEERPSSKPELPAYVVVEKILGLDEPLPADWPIAGTTGYDFLNLVNGVFVDASGVNQLTRHYERFTEASSPFREIVYDCKRLILSTSMQSEVQLLAHRLDRLSHRHRRFRDFTLQHYEPH